jgi:hypothetical protein
VSGASALELPFAEPTGYGLGKERARNNFPTSWWLGKSGVVPLG